MTDHFDHAAEAQRGLGALRKNLIHVIPASEKRGGFTNDERIRLAEAGAAKAQALATLALHDAQLEANRIAREAVEQQRVANFLAFAADPGVPETARLVAAAHAWSLLGITDDKETNE